MIIGITGKKFHGKDTVGKILCKKYNFIRYAYADKLKRVCQIIFGFDDSQLYGNRKEHIDSYWKVSPRNMMQFVGTDLFRNQLNKILPDDNNDIWIKSLEHDIENNINSNIVITDVRFPNEIESIRKHGGKIIKVTRSDLIYYDDHESERVDDLYYDYEIMNDHDIETLENRIIEVYNELKK